MIKTKGFKNHRVRGRYDGVTPLTRRVYSLYHYDMRGFRQYYRIYRSKLECLQTSRHYPYTECELDHMLYKEMGNKWNELHGVDIPNNPISRQEAKRKTKLGWNPRRWQR